MGKKLGGVNWKSVALEGVALDGAGLDGFVGLEECTEYDLDVNIVGKKKMKKEKSRKEAQKRAASEISRQMKSENKSQDICLEPSSKKLKLSSGFTVEECTRARPSTDSEPHELENANKKDTASKDISAANKPEESDKHAGMDMSAWSNFEVPEEILRALAEQGFEKPTRIQELCLPPAMLGRRDILGAAETGSGKTLAFGIPILAGILKLKEKEESGQDVYDARFKKSSIKKKTGIEITRPKKKSINKNKIIYPKNENKAITTERDKCDNNYTDLVESSNSNVSNVDDDASKLNIGDENSQIHVNEQDSDSDDNYVHMSDLIDSDALEDSSDEEKDAIVDPNDSDSENDGTKSDENYEIGASDGEEPNSEDTKQGLGCVKVVDDVDLPACPIVKTGKPLYGLIITPTRELAIQISKHLTVTAKYTGIRIATLVGGLAQVKQERLLSRSPELVVCTPGRLWELIRQGERHLQQLDTLKFLAIDETDRMMEKNHFEELQPLLERLNADDGRRSNRQNFVMSATLTMTHDLPGHMRGKKVTKRGKIINQKLQKMTPQQKTKKLIAMLGMTDPKIVDLTEENKGKAGTLTECRITCALDQKDFYLFYILRTHPGRTIIFCNSIGCVKRLAQIFGLLKCRPLPLHAGMPQRQRLKNLERFRDDPHGVLIATDVAARGLDIPGVDHVIHYQVPRTAENYVHRSGRTARANKEGLTILMMEPGEAFLYSKLCRTLNKTTELAEFPVPESALSVLRACVSLARDVEAASLACKRRAQESGWLEKAARECDLLVDEDFVPMKKKLDNDDSEQATKMLQLKKKRLDSLLSKPIVPRFFSYKYPSLNDPNALVVEQENALEKMKKIIKTGAVKREKRTSKNAPLLKLGKTFKQKSKGISKEKIKNK